MQISFIELIAHRYTVEICQCFSVNKDIFKWLSWLQQHEEGGMKACGLFTNCTHEKYKLVVA